MNSFIINAADDKQASLEIIRRAGAFKTSYQMKKDYCDYINDELREWLAVNGIKATAINGFYKVGTLDGWLDEDDFTDAELEDIYRRYGGTYREDLEAYVKSLPEREQRAYYFIPHVFLKCRRLILDAACEMFDGLGKCSKYRYFYNDYRLVIGE